MKGLQNAVLIREKVPQEILDKIRGELVSSIIANNKEIMESNNNATLIKKVEGQVKELYDVVNRVNKYFWPALLQPGNTLNQRPEVYSPGSPEHMVISLQYCYDSWAETPGALEVIKKMANGDD